jgi:hypothetical protein
LTTVLVSNRSKVTPETCSMADEVPHKRDEKDIDTIDTDPSGEVTGSHHPSLFSDLTASDDSVDLDDDLQAELRASQEAAMAAMAAAMERTKQELRKEQFKRNRAKQAEHEDQKKPAKKRRDDEDDKDGNEGGGKPTAAAAAAAPPAVSAK